MSNHRVLEEFSFASSKKIIFTLKIGFLVLVVVGFGIYVGNLLFGKNSLEVLLNLQEKKTVFKQEIRKYKNQNAALQKDYFELLELEPSSN